VTCGASQPRNAAYQPESPDPVAVNRAVSQAAAATLAPIRGRAALLEGRP
jgi:hypothetical protein